MANSRSSGHNKEYATVEEAPDETGFFTNDICPRDFNKEGTGKVFFSIRDAVANLSAAPSAGSDIDVILQFLCPGDTEWTNYVPLDGSEFAVGNRVALEDMGAGVLWRAGVTDAGYGSGAVVFGFDW
jgi:hypothetical protein